MNILAQLVENYFGVKSNLELSTIVKGSMESGSNQFAVRQALESHVLNSVHIVMTTLGSAGGRVLENADKFEVVVGKLNVVSSKAAGTKPRTPISTKKLPILLLSQSRRSRAISRAIHTFSTPIGVSSLCISRRYKSAPCHYFQP